MDLALSGVKWLSFKVHGHIKCPICPVVAEISTNISFHAYTNRSP